MRTILTIFGALLVVQSAVAAEAEKEVPSELEMELAACAEKTLDFRRLECFDELMQKRGVVEAPPEKKTGRWIIRGEKSEVDDSERISLVVIANEHLGGRTRPELNIECRENRTMFYIDWKDYLGIDSVRMTHRLDDAKAVTMHWPVSTNFEAAFRSPGGQSIQMAKSLIGKNKMIARVTPYGKNLITATFDIAGLEEAIKPLRAACKW